MRPMISNCARIKRELVAYIDNELGRRRSAKVKQHLEACAGCRHELGELSQVGRLVADLSSLAADNLLQAEILRRARDTALQRRRGWRSMGWRVPALTTAAAVASLVIWQMGVGIDPRPVEVGQRGRAQASRLVQQYQQKVEGSGQGGSLAESVPAAPERTASSSLVGGSRAVARRGGRIQVPALMIAVEKNVPSDLTDNPGLYLELGVLRDLEKLENFEAILQASSGQGRDYKEGANAGQG